MCGRFTLVETNKLSERFRTINTLGELKPNYNTAPSHIMPVATEAEQGSELKLMRWGLIPVWAKDPSIGYKMINARSETVAEKPSFRSAYKKRRCLVPANGYYEWKTEGKTKTPYYIHLPNHQLFGFAGLWEYWEDTQKQPVHSFTIITAEAQNDMRQLHHRVPIILNKSVENAWLDASINDSHQLDDLLRHNQADSLEFYEVSPEVNSVKNNSPELINHLHTN